MVLIASPFTDTSIHLKQLIVYNITLSKNREEMRPNNNIDLVNTSREEMRKKRRKKRKRVAVLFVVVVMGMIVHWYHRKRPRHIIDPDEVVERDVTR